jgi:hypothetical protein
MSAPRRWVNDPDADEALRDVLRATPRARSLDAVTRRRLSAKVARAAALPAVAAGWLFVKSAAAALGVVLGTGAVAVATGVVEWSPKPEAAAAVVAPAKAPAARRAPARAAVAASPVVESAVDVNDPVAKVNPTPSLPVATPSSSGTGTLSAEAALLERARREMRGAPAMALSFAAEHAKRFPRGQLASERTLIQIEALHRLNRDREARSLGRSMLGAAGAGLYSERVHQLLGENLDP